MALRIDHRLTAPRLLPEIERLLDLSAQKILSLERTWVPARGTPVVTVRGKYSSRAWTEWTQGFVVGSALLQFDATGEQRFLEIGRRKTIHLMAPHVSHMGVHDHGFNNISTYGNLWRLMREGKIPFNEREEDLYELALKVSGAVQAARWTAIADGQGRGLLAAPCGAAAQPHKSPACRVQRPGAGQRRRLFSSALLYRGAPQPKGCAPVSSSCVPEGPRSQGYIYSFNGPHSLFVDTMRSLRSLAVAHQLGHVLRGERDQRISLLERLIAHADATARYCIYYGKGRDAFDVRGRTAHESIFNLRDGSYRCPNSQQGYSPFSTWMRGLAWAILGYAEQLEFFGTLNAEEAGRAPGALRNSPRNQPHPTHDAGAPEALFLEAARATADFYLANSCTDGIPMWDTGAPNLHRLGAYLMKPADPFNRWEPVDSSAAAIAAQGLVRLGNYLWATGDESSGERYRQAGLTVANTLFDEPYLSTNPKHQGLLLHSVYHRPNGWDYIAPGQKVPNGESSMWGDYHARELALLLLREARCEAYPTFFGGST